MKCPKCGNDESTVIDTDRFDTLVKRVRKCQNKKCRHTWNTHETEETPDKSQNSASHPYVNDARAG